MPDLSKTPPDYIPTWATDGGAVVTDPGAAKRADGWLVNEVPSSGVENSLNKEQGNWLAFLQRLLAPQMAWQNIWMQSTAEDTAPPSWPNDRPEIYHQTYDAILGKHIVTWLDRSGGTAGNGWYETTDGGLTWVDSQTALPGSPITEGAHGSNGQYIVTASQDDCFVSTTGSVANLAYVTDAITPGDAGQVRAILWDPINSIWVIISNFSGTVITTITGDPSVPGNWSKNVATIPGQVPVGAAIDPSTGFILLQTTGTTNYSYRSTDAAHTTWTQGAGILNDTPVGAVMFNEATKQFVGINTNGFQTFSDAGIPGFNWFGNGRSDIYNFLNSDDFLLTVTNATSFVSEVYARPIGFRDAAHMADSFLGTWYAGGGVDDTIMAALGGGDTRCVCESGASRVLLWPFSTSNLARSAFK